ncbi:MAG: universal stress protein [Cyanobacteria bacterium J083]|nr:MAG: universal stress protein [Cyanobacteria bacterium J083]
MFEKILVAIDDSPGNQAVFQKALSIAKANNARLILLHVLWEEANRINIQSKFGQDSYSKFAPETKSPRQQNFLKNRGLNILRSLIREASAAGVKSEFTQITGDPSSTICEFAQSCQADLIVMGKQSYYDLEKIFLGSVSNYVLYHAPCSVLLVQTPIVKKQKVLSLHFSANN